MGSRRFALIHRRQRNRSFPQWADAAESFALILAEPLSDRSVP
jgi:hypothetical protein